MKKIIVLLLMIITGLTALWSIDEYNRPVEAIDELIGRDFNFAVKAYFQTEPDQQYKVNINSNLDEFNGGILNKSGILRDSIVHVFTWKYTTHKKTLWVGKTETMESEVIDAIRYNNKFMF